MAASQDIPDTDETPETSKESAYHCCVPLCNGDSRYNRELKFHRLPGRAKDEQLKKKWLIKIRRDEGPNFKLTSNTRLCYRHFTEEDYLPPTASGRKLLKRGAVPSKFNWSSKATPRRKIIRHVDRDTQTKKSDDGEDVVSHSETPTLSMVAMQSEIQSLQAQLLAAQKQLDQSEGETRAALNEVESVKAQAALEIQEIRKQAAEQLALHKFGLERFGTDNESIKFYTGFPSNALIQSFFSL